MRLKLRYFCAIIIISCYFIACVKPFAPKLVASSTNYLVVEGFINISDSTFIKLSRTVDVGAKSAAKAELKAIVTIESNNGKSYTVPEAGNGLYQVSSYALSPINQYRLRIKTSNGYTYLSDFAVAKTSPSIDTVAWQSKTDGVHISLNTHDSQNATRYYRWDYIETWELRTFWTSYGVFSNGAIVPRTQMVNHCWNHQNNISVMLGSSITLSQDVIYNQPVTFVPIGSEKLSWRYSILLKQYPLTADAYQYWALLKKNTEELGSIFDAQPSASIGNIHNVNNPAEPVIGYVSAGTVSSKRIFIDRPTQLSFDYFQQYINGLLAKCDTVTNKPLSYYAIMPEVIVPFVTGLAGFEPPECGDCTVNGGTVTQPSYW